MNLVVTIKLEANTHDGQIGVDAPNSVNINHSLEFNLNGDNLNGPSITNLEDKFFNLANLVREIIK